MRLMCFLILMGGKVAKKSVSESAKPADVDPAVIVGRVVGCGLQQAAVILERMGAAAGELPAKYAAGQARDWITEHNVKPAKPATIDPETVEAPIG